MKNPQNINVLLVEDDYLAGEMIREILHEIGYTVLDRVTDGSQAVEMMTDLAAETRPDVILMDVEMPHMDGIEATRLIQEKCPTPVVMLTAYETPELVALASQAGALT